MVNILESPLLIAVVVVAALIIIALIVYLMKQISDSNSKITELENVNAVNVKEISEWKEQKKNLPALSGAIQDIAKHTNALIQANNIRGAEARNVNKSLKNIQNSLAEKEIFFKLVGDKKEAKKSKKSSKKSSNKSSKRSKKDKDYESDSSSSDSDSSSGSSSESESEDMASDILKELDKKRK
jgi:hypothetical protein